ncbi:MAG: hypothetical protein KatS3mg098_267 [Candidatus Parcubacteria bacterium]|nr:MAG: hypothetical protein KatS3mg098_267 [Candidatus Parcubacteria bacterium]
MSVSFMRLNKKFLRSFVVIVIAFVTLLGLSDLIFVLSGVFDKINKNPSEKIMEKVSLKTEDGRVLAANYFEVTNPEGWVLYLHMMPATKESFNDLAQKLAQKRFAGLALDLRGHGESEGGPQGYLSFSDKEHQDSYFDVLAGIDFLKSRGATEEKIYLVGASIGANLALKYLAQHPQARGGVLLSPGINYRGITTRDLVVHLSTSSRVIFLASRDDGDNASEVEELFALVPEGVKKEKIILENAGHGTKILENEAWVTERIIDFLTQ